MFVELASYNQFETALSEEPAVLVYFSNEGCGVCKSLKPKVEELADQHFHEMKTFNINTDRFPEITGQFRIFALPALLVFFYGKETIRKLRNFSMKELSEELNRPYSLIFRHE